jgi:hypothetical protein
MAAREDMGRTLDSSFVSRVAAGLKYIVSGVGPDNWFGPMQPLQPQAQQQAEGRAFDFPVGYNLRIQPRSEETVSFAQLRQLADAYDLMRLVLETRKDQIEAFEWEIVPKDKDVKPETRKQDIRAVTEFLEKPDQERYWPQWLRSQIEDMLVLDAICVYPRPDRGGRLYALELVAPDNIKRVIDETGRTPLPPSPAYQHILKGIPAADYTTDTFVYQMRNPRSNRIYGFCFAPDMEILTRAGWKRVGEASYDDEFATRNPETHVFEWQRPVAVTSREFEGELVHFKAKSLDILVTPEHRMLVQCDRPDVDPRERTVTAGELARLDAHWRVPIASDGWAGERIESRRFGGDRVEQIKSLRQDGRSYMQIAREVDCAVGTVADVVTERYDYTRDRVELSGEDYCAFMGMYLSEGSINKGRVVVISQSSTSKHFNKFKTALSRMFRSATHVDGDFSIYSLSLATYLKQFGHSHEKFVPEDVMNATTEQIETFLEYLFDGDAHRNPRGATYYYTTSKRLADQVQELVQKIGKAASVRPCELRSSILRDGRVIRSLRQQYRVSILRRRYMHPVAARVPYHGPVHCLSVPNQTVYVRRNGYAAWTKQSPVEQVITTVNIAIRRQMSQLQFYTEGNVPEAIAQVPDTWTGKQIAEFQLMWDSMNEGNTAQRRKMRFIPSLKDIIFPKDAVLKDEYDEWLARIVCFAFSISPTALIKQVNRASSEQMSETAKEEGLIPLLRFLEVHFTALLQRHQNGKGLRFRFKIQNKVSPQEQAAIDASDIASKIRTPDEARVDRGLEPMPEAEREKHFPAGPDPLELAQVQAKARAGQPVPPGKPDEKEPPVVKFEQGDIFVTVHGDRAAVQRMPPK